MISIFIYFIVSSILTKYSGAFTRHIIQEKKLISLQARVHSGCANRNPERLAGAGADGRDGGVGSAPGHLSGQIGVAIVAVYTDCGELHGRAGSHIRIGGRDLQRQQRRHA